MNSTPEWDILEMILFYFNEEQVIRDLVVEILQGDSDHNSNIQNTVWGWTLEVNNQCLQLNKGSFDGEFV